jgi:hypothetical protein
MEKEITPVVEVPKVRSFRHAPDVEKFYRFVFENNLRREAKMMLEQIFNLVQAKKRKRAKKQLH